MLFPIVAFSHCRDVVAAASKAGGIGVLGAAAFTPEQLDIELAWIDDHCGGRPYGVNVLSPAGASTTDPSGAITATHLEFVAELADRFGVPPPKHLGNPTPFGDASVVSRDAAEHLIEVALAHPIAMVVSALGTFEPALVERIRSNGALVGGMVGTARHGVRHAEAGADFVVAQGYEAAGHTGEISTMVLTPEVVEAVDPLPVLAAGGITTGRQVAAALALGAQGVWTGSVWLTTIESDVDDLVKQRLHEATSSDTVRSTSTTGKPMRSLRNPLTDAWSQPGAPTPLAAPLQGMLMRDLLVSIYEHRIEHLMTSAAGQGVGMIRRPRSTAQVMMDLVDEAIDSLASVQAQFDDDFGS